jgi:REP element-mobilizing transposase RayT
MHITGGCAIAGRRINHRHSYAIVLRVWPTNNQIEGNILSESGMCTVITEYPQFFTATCLVWKHLVQDDQYKDIITKNLRSLVNDGRVMAYGLVIMANHLHVVWQMGVGHQRQSVQRDFHKYTAQQIKDARLRHPPAGLEQFRARRLTASICLGSTTPCRWPHRSGQLGISDALERVGRCCPFRR